MIFVSSKSLYDDNLAAYIATSLYLSNHSMKSYIIIIEYLSCKCSFSSSFFYKINQFIFVSIWVLTEQQLYWNSTHCKVIYNTWTTSNNFISPKISKLSSKNIYMITIKCTWTLTTNNPLNIHIMKLVRKALQMSSGLLFYSACFSFLFEQ